MMGSLYIIATPIGNLEDITLRALRVLKEVDYILAEDTRVTMRLLSYYDIHTKVVRLDAHKEREGVARVIQDLQDGKQIGLVSDAGTPLISDPGVRLVSAAREAGCTVAAIPGASSLTAALSIAGVPTEHFTFMGFAPHKKGRQTFFKEAVEMEGTVVFFESTHRIIKCLESLVAVAPQRSVHLCRELTKMHEEVLSGTPALLLEKVTNEPVKQKGEFVVILA